MMASSGLTVDSLTGKCLWVWCVPAHRFFDTVKDIMSGQTPSNPVVQVVAMKKIPIQAGKPERWRLQINDGVYKQQSTMLATQLNEMVNDGQIEKNTVLSLDHYLCNEVSERKIIIILKCSVLGKAESLLGTPVLIKDEHVKAGGPPGGAPAPAAKKPAPAAAPAAAPAPASVAMSGVEEKKPATKAPSMSNPYNAIKSPPRQKAGPRGGSASSRYQPITALGPFNKKFTIRARCTKKGDVRTWDNGRTSGKLFSVDLVDASGEIRATSFNQNVDRLEQVFEVGKIYIISNGKLRPANTKFNNLNNHYEITFDDATTVSLDHSAGDDDSVPTIQFDFQPFKTFNNAEANTFKDVLGICTELSDAVKITTKAQKELLKRDISLTDRDSMTVACTLWGAEAEAFEANGGGIGVPIAIKAARLSDYNGVSMSVSMQSTMQINPDIPEARSLLGWYMTEGKDKGTTKMTQAQPSRGTPRAYLSQIKGDNMGMGDATYFMSKVTVVNIMKEKALYKGCPGKKPDGKPCNKKLVEDEGSSSYKCTQCDRDYDNFNWRLFMSFTVADPTGETWISAFQEDAQLMLGHDADTLGKWKEEDNARYEKAISDATFKQWLLKCRAKEETWAEEVRVKVSCLNAHPIDYVQECKDMIETIKKYK